MIYLAYRDIPNQPGTPQGFELMPNRLSSRTIKPGIIPALMGLPTIFIRHLKLTVEGQIILIVSYTEHELTKADVKQITVEAMKFLHSENVV